jgi:hypothetical protein
VSGRIIAVAVGLATVVERVWVVAVAVGIVGTEVGGTLFVGDSWSSGVGVLVCGVPPLDPQADSTNVIRIHNALSRTTRM